VLTKCFFQMIWRHTGRTVPPANPPGPSLHGAATAQECLRAGLLDELCLTLSPLLAGPGAGRIVADIGPLHQPGGAGARPLGLAHVLADDGHLLCRYLRPADG
jgi:hypothetical protein